jgi:hypothetical protein
MFFGYNPSRKTGWGSRRRSRMFSRPKSGTRASIQPIGNPVPASESEISTFQTLLNKNNNINPDVFADAGKQSKANKMRQAYSSFLSKFG